ncbi:retrotransposon protein, putative, ty1-copia subclass [Tanacetum coccineum]
MLKASKELDSKNVSLDALVKKRIRDGMNMKFWEDVWIGECKLMEKFPQIFRLDTETNAMVNDRIVLSLDSGWLRRRPRGGAESEQWNHLLSLARSIIDTVETGSHILMRCQFALKIWRQIARWWDLDIPHMLSMKELLERVDNLKFSKNQKKGLYIVRITTAWSIWRFHNEMVFGVDKPKKALIFDFIFSKAFFWMSNRNKKLRCMFSGFVGLCVFVGSLYDVDWEVIDTNLEQTIRELPIPTTPVPDVVGQQIPPEIPAAHAAWVKGQKEITVLMLMIIEPDLQRNLETLGAYDMLKELKTLFAQQVEQELLQTVREFHACKQEEGQSHGEDGKVLNKNKNKKPQLAAKGNNKGKGKSKFAYAPKPKIPPPPKKEDPAKDSVGHHCGDIGHWKWNCPQYLSELLKKKKISQGASTLVFQKEVENQLRKTIKSLHSDRGGKYMSQEFLDHLKEHGIIAHRTPPYTPQHNEVSERRNRTLLDRVCSMMSQITLLKSFWNYALQSAACIINMVPTKRFEKTPYKVCSIKCIFVGYPKETMGYSFYYPPKKKVFVARNVEFFENSLIIQEASGSLEDLKIIQEDNTHPSEITSSHHYEDNQEIDEPQSDIILIRRSTRTRHAPERMCLNIEADEYELGDLNDPANYKSALSDPEKTVSSKWFFKKKTDMDGVVHTYKSHIRAIRILIAIAVFYDYEIWQIDVKTAFLNGYLSKEDVKSYIGRCFTMKIFGEAAYILGIKIYKDRSKRIPMQEKLKLSKSQGSSTAAEVKPMQNVQYTSAVGSIMYDVRRTCPDVAFARNITSRFQKNPRELH